MKIDLELFTQTEKVLEKRSDRSKTVGVCNETRYGDQRVSLSPTHASELNQQGYTILIESGAGLRSGYSDADYTSKGVKVVNNKESIFKSDVVSCLNIPLLSELEMMLPKAILVSEFPLRRLKDEALTALLKKEITTLSIEQIYDDNNERAYYRIMSELVATSIPVMASQIFLERKTIFGGVAGFSQPKIAIFGAGMTGEKVGCIMNQLGFDLTYFDDSISNIRQIQKHFNNALKTYIIPCFDSDISLSDFDLIIFTKEFDRELISSHLLNPEQITKDTLVLDVAFDYRGNMQLEQTLELTIQRVQHFFYGLINDFPKRFPVSASPIISHFVYSYAMKISRFGSFTDYVKFDRNFARGIVTYKGVVCHPNVANKFDLPLYEIDFIIDS